MENENDFSSTEVFQIEQSVDSNELDEFADHEGINNLIEHLQQANNSDNLDNYQIKDRSKLCYVCDESKIVFFFPCGNGLCEECILEHLKAQINKYKVKILSEKINFICAGSCRCPVDKETMEKLMNKETKELYEEVIFKMYLSKSDEILTCPRSDCSGFGFVNSNVMSNMLLKFSNNKCYECPLCKHKWNLEQTKTLVTINPINLIKNFCFSDIKSSIKKYVTTKYCNKCSAPIEKLDGCKHMECNRCEFSFCWKCMDDWKTHSELSCMGINTNVYDESLRPEFAPFIFLALLILTILKTVFSFTIILWLLWLLVKSIIFFGFMAVDAFFIHGSILAFTRFKNKKKCLFILLSGFVFEISLYMLYWHPFNRKMYYYLLACFLPSYVLIMAIKKKLN